MVVDADKVAPIDKFGGAQSYMPGFVAEVGELPPSPGADGGKGGRPLEPDITPDVGEPPPESGRVAEEDKAATADKPVGEPSTEPDIVVAMDLVAAGDKSLGAPPAQVGPRLGREPGHHRDQARGDGTPRPGARLVVGDVGRSSSMVVDVGEVGIGNEPEGAQPFKSGSANVGEPPPAPGSIADVGSADVGEPPPASGTIE